MLKSVLSIFLLIIGSNLLAEEDPNTQDANTKEPIVENDNAEKLKDFQTKYCQEYGKNLQSCTHYKCEYPHPAILILEGREVISTREILGKDGKNCITTETIPPTKIICLLPSLCLARGKSYYEKMMTGDPTDESDPIVYNWKECTDKFCRIKK